MKSFFSILSLAIISVILVFCLGAFNAYFYPMTFKEEIISFGKSYNVSSALVASVANVESNFNEKAVSNNHRDSAVTQHRTQYSFCC